MNVVDPPKEISFKSEQEYQKALGEWQSQHEQSYELWESKHNFGLYWNEYGDYFESEEARRIIRSFFEEMDRIMSQG